MVLVPELTFYCSLGQKKIGICKVVLLCHNLRINIHWIIHLNLKSTVTTKSLHFCIFIHFFQSLFLWFSFVTFVCFTCNNFQHIFPPISDNNYFYFQFISSFVYWSPSNAAPLALFGMEWFQGLYLSYWIYVIVISIGDLICNILH